MIVFMIFSLLGFLVGLWIGLLLWLWSALRGFGQRGDAGGSND